MIGSKKRVTSFWLDEGFTGDENAAMFQATVSHGFDYGVEVVTVVDMVMGDKNGVGVMRINAILFGFV